MACFRAAVFFMLFGAAASVSDECLYMDACSEDEVMATEEAVMEKTRVDLLSVRVSASPAPKSKKKKAGPIPRFWPGIGQTTSGVGKKAEYPATYPEGMQRHGTSTCQCVGIENMTGHVDVQLEGYTVKYPADIGSTCHAWDAGRHPDCNAKRAVKPKWCSRPWCYVDPCTCHGLPRLPQPDTKYIPGGRYQSRRLYKSYATCYPTSTNYEDKGNKLEIGLECAYPQDSMKIGNDDCRCIGLEGLPGMLNRTWNGKTHLYPADTGSYCKAWDLDHHTDCVGRQAPASCLRQWCFVDPCTCRNVRNAPEPSGFQGHWRGRPLYTSYDTCGDDTTVGAWATPTMCR